MNRQKNRKLFPPAQIDCAGGVHLWFIDPLHEWKLNKISLTMQTSPIIPAHLLLERLMDELQLFSFQWRFELIGHYGPCLRLAAQHPSTGDLVMWVEDNEITLVIEFITHSHFNCPYYLLNSSVEAQAKAIAQEAADYVLDVLLDRILFEMEWQGDRLASVSNIPILDGIPPQKELPQGVRRKRFLWSGPYQEAP